MIFNSFEFLVFLLVVFCLYWFVFNKSVKHQNLLLLFSSYVFYGWWDYRFLSLIFLSTIVDYTIGLNIHKQKSVNRKKLFLWTSILFNLTLLGFFKYYNFFIDSWINLVQLLGYEIKSVWTLSIILPVGISFYTFQTMSYTIDIYRQQLKPTKDFIAFASFISFFPQLVAGPIERASNLLPQILNNRKFVYKDCVQGLRLIVWGMFKKVVIADSLSPLVDNIFMNYDTLGGGTLLLGLFYFSFQIYCDFSGYSDIAIGTSKLLGINIISNFNYPFFSRNIAEFWRRWHISLTTWFTNYFYFPLKLEYRNSGVVTNFLILMLYFSLIGFWHGSNWTFVVFGIYHGLLFLPTLINPKFYVLKTKQIAYNKSAPSIKEFLQVLITFFLVSIGWVFFRSENISDSFEYLMIIASDFDFPYLNKKGFLFIFLLLFVEYFVRSDERLNFKINSRIENVIIAIIIIIILFSYTDSTSFIYFQF